MDGWVEVKPGAGYYVVRAWSPGRLRGEGHTGRVVWHGCTITETSAALGTRVRCHM